MNTEDNLLLQKLMIFLEEKKKVHISKYDKIFHNGSIQKINSINKYVILCDDKENDIIILFDEIKDIVLYKTKEESANDFAC